MPVAVLLRRALPAALLAGVSVDTCVTRGKLPVSPVSDGEQEQSRLLDAPFALTYPAWLISKRELRHASRRR
jgi:hypothetical protein